MVELTRRPHQVVTFQAGPGGGDHSTQFDVHLRISDRAARAFGRQLAAIGDQLDHEWVRREPNWPPTPFHLLRPARNLTWTIYQDVHSQLWGFQGLLAAVKAWLMSTTAGQGSQRAEVTPNWVSSFKVASCPGWTRGALLTVALLAAASMFAALWMEEHV